MWAVWLRVSHGLRQVWRSLVVLGANHGPHGGRGPGVHWRGRAGLIRRCSRFLQYAGPTEGEVSATPRTMDEIAALPSVAYSGLRCADVRGSGHCGRPGYLRDRPGEHLGLDSQPAAGTGDHRCRTAGRVVTRQRSDDQRNGCADPEGTRRVGDRFARIPARSGSAGGKWRRAASEGVLPAVRVAGVIRTPTDLTEIPTRPRRHVHGTAKSTRRPLFTTGSPAPSLAYRGSGSISSAARQASQPSKRR